MNFYLQQILDWSEAWAPLIPLSIYLIYKPKHKWVRPVIWYLVIAFILSLLADILWKRFRLGIEDWLQANFHNWYEADQKTLKNTVLYNLHSISRLLLFSWFFHYLGPIFRKMNSFIPLLFFVGAIVNFIWLQPIEDFSSRLFTIESGILLFYCIVYYFFLLTQDREVSPGSRNSFLVVVGLSIYVAFNFFIFLFYHQLSIEFKVFARHIWDYHNLSYIILCIFIGLALHKK